VLSAIGPGEYKLPVDVHAPTVCFTDMTSGKQIELEAQVENVEEKFDTTEIHRKTSMEPTVSSRSGSAALKPKSADEESPSRSGERDRLHHCLENAEGDWRHADDRPSTGGFSTRNRGDAGKPVPLPEPEIDRQQAIHHEPAKGLGSNAEEGGRSIFHASRSCGAALLPG